MQLTPALVQRMTTHSPSSATLLNFCEAFNEYAPRFAIDRPAVVAHFCAQIFHESGDLKWSEEIWGPTAAQARYEGRADLGNTEPGDGERFKGHGWIQTTGRANHRQFFTWCRAHGILHAPDFERWPEMVADEPWATVSAISFWERKGLNRYAEANNIEMLTRRINGGLNGYTDRLLRYTRCALTLLGYGHTDGELRRYQFNAGIDVDGIAGPQTRQCLHEDCLKLEKDK